MNCLGSSHRTKDCRSAGCRKCGKVHHSMLHSQNNETSENNTSISSDDSSILAATGSGDGTPTLQHTLTTCLSSPSHILLSTAVIKVYDEFNKAHQCRVLLGNGSQITNYIPTSPLHSTELNIPKKLALAGPNFDKSAPIDLLIEADTFWNLLCIGQVK
ncbi:hypothetical protein JTB14_004966 [Gonioctena quinquepunctata]|nr:hypothetical protein JTB14_004966 [Gonioctena quinquepunctata]